MFTFECEKVEFGMKPMVRASTALPLVSFPLSLSFHLHVSQLLLVFRSHDDVFIDPTEIFSLSLSFPLLCTRIVVLAEHSFHPLAVHFSRFFSFALVVCDVPRSRCALCCFSFCRTAPATA